MGNAKAIIEAHHLYRTFHTKKAVSDVSFSVQPGEIFGLPGPNGAGKTTTIRMLTGQLDPSSGSATVAGCDTVKQRQRLKERIGVVFEDQNLYERLSARQNLAFSCWLYGLPESRIDEVLALVQLRERARDRISTFSNGMRQRIMIARALLHRPAVLFLDEPSRGLDPISAQEIRQTIQRLSQEGTAILLTTHLMEEADQLCQRVAFLVNGRIVANDTPRNLKLSHGQRTMTVTLGGTGELTEHTIKLDDPYDQAELAHWMSQGTVRAIHTNEATLEEAFIEVAGGLSESSSGSRKGAPRSVV
jgi:ABC-2 type transport system ATP-binding protein